MGKILTWDDTYAIARTLKQEHPRVSLEAVSLGMIQQWTLDLVDFDDDPTIVNDDILMAIYLEWFEEVNSV